MKLELTAKSNLKQVGEAMNELKLLDAVRQLIIRVDKLTNRIAALEENRPNGKSALSRIGKYESYILDILSNGRIWSTHSMEEELRIRHPELPEFKQLGLQHACGRLHKSGIIEKVSKCNYRKKES